MEHWRTLKRTGSDDLLGQQVLNCLLRLSPPLLTSLLPRHGDFYSRRGYLEPGGLSGSLSQPFPPGGTGDLQHRSEYGAG